MFNFGNLIQSQLQGYSQTEIVKQVHKKAVQTIAHLYGFIQPKT
jgi:hypothetical protein